MISTDQQKINEILTRSVDSIYPSKEDFEKMLKSGRQLRIYMGIDPTATYVHLGHATNYLILRRLHELGHKIIVLIGDFTAMIGDPSDKSAARKRLTPEDVRINLKTFKEQISKILDFENKENPIEFKFNADWLAKLSFSDAVDLAANFTVQRMLERDIFERRIKENKPLYVHEFFYPLMQGYDSVALAADVEIGGTDQIFNMLAGRQLVQAYQKREKIVMTTTLLVNPVTGEKLMSKSLGTGIGLDEKPEDMYGKVMSMADEVIIQVFIDCTQLSMGEINEFKKSLATGANPRDIKMILAREIVTMYHSPEDAARAEENFIRIFQKHEKPIEVEVVKLSREKVLRDGKITAMELFVGAEMVASKNELRRLVEQEGLKINDQVVSDIDKDWSSQTEFLLQRGKRQFKKVVLS